MPPVGGAQTQQGSSPRTGAASSSTTPFLIVRPACRSDLPAIEQIQERICYANRSEQSRRQKGFVTLRTPVPLLEKILSEGTILVAERKPTLVGFVMACPPSLARDDLAPALPALGSLLDHISQLQDDQRLPVDGYCILLQDYVSSSVRGQPVLPAFYKGLQTELSGRFGLGLSAISSTNQVSYHAHVHKLGMKVVADYREEGATWHLVQIDLKPSP